MAVTLYRFSGCSFGTAVRFTAWARTFAGAVGTACRERDNFDLATQGAIIYKDLI